MGLFDIMSGWGAWAPFTFVIVGLMGYTVGYFAEKKPIKNTFVNNLVSLVLALAIKLVGYYFAEVLLTGNWIAPFGSMPGNITQVGFAIVVALIVAPVLKLATRKVPGSIECTR